MDFNSLKPNSFKSKENSEPVDHVHQQPIVSGSTRYTQSKPEKIKDSIFSGSTKGAIDYVIEKVVVPKIKDAIYEAIVGFAAGTIYKNNRDIPATRKPGGGYQQSNYQQYWASSGKPNVYLRTPPQSMPQQNRSQTIDNSQRPDYQSILINQFDDNGRSNRGPCERIIETMKQLIYKNGHVTVAELYDMTSYVGDPPEWNVGWDKRSIPEFGIRYISDRDAYLIVVPQAYPVPTDEERRKMEER